MASHENHSANQPAWTSVGFEPNQGIVRASLLHVSGREATRQLLLDSAMVEFSKEQFGTSIKLNSQVTKTTQTYNDAVNRQFTQTDSAQITSANQRAKVKAKIKSEWYSPKTQQLYLWIVPVQ